MFRFEELLVSFGCLIVIIYFLQKFDQFFNAHLSQSSQVEIVYKPGDGVSPRQKIRQNAATTPSPAILLTPSNGTPKRSPSSSSVNKLYVTSPVDRGLSPSRQSQSKDLPKSAGASDSNKLSGISGTRSITDTASTVLNTKLDEGKFSSDVSFMKIWNRF